MAKRRSCRRSDDQNVIHAKAVKLRKMTDDQLVSYVENRVEKARAEGYNQGRKKARPEKVDVNQLVDEIGALRGVGKVKLKEIQQILETRLGGGTDKLPGAGENIGGNKIENER